MKKLVEYWEIVVSIITLVAMFGAMSSRVSAVEVRQKEDGETLKEISRDVGDIKEDVSYIRGKLEK